MPFAELNQSVLEPRLCTGCGACALACPKEAIRFDADDVVSPKFVLDAEACGSCRACVDVCPGRDPGTPEQEVRLLGRTRTEAERWVGIYQDVYGGASADPATFNASASGGSTTTLLAAAMRYFGAPVALVMGREPDRPWRSAPALVRSKENLDECAQSTYQLAPYLLKLRELFAAEPHTNVVMSGIACHVQAVRKLQCLDTPVGQWARERIKFVIEIGCSSNTLPTGTETLIGELAKVSLSEVTRMKYREGDYPGQIAVSNKKSEISFVPFWQAVRHFADNKTHRCLSCGDWVSGLADITVSDGDPNIFDGSLGLNRIHKHGRIFVRTGAGVQALRFAVLMDMLEIWPVALEGLNLGLERKRNRRAAYERSDKPLPLGPIPGYVEAIDIKPDAAFLAVPADGNKKQESPESEAKR
jgi:coenzyme F420 hydrogenase subunit beta